MHELKAGKMIVIFFYMMLSMFLTGLRKMCWVKANVILVDLKILRNLLWIAAVDEEVMKSGIGKHQ